MPLRVTPACHVPGQRTKHGTRYAPSQLLFFSEAKRGDGAVGPCVVVRAVVGRVHDDGVVGEPELVELVEDHAHVVVVLDHGVVVVALPAQHRGSRP